LLLRKKASQEKKSVTSSKEKKINPIIPIFGIKTAKKQHSFICPFNKYLLCSLEVEGIMEGFRTTTWNSTWSQEVSFVCRQTLKRLSITAQAGKHYDGKNGKVQ
jgi:hypothetical protein